MAEKKKPDNVVFNYETQKYDASIKTYATDLGAPAIRPIDTSDWKNRSINKVNQQMQAKYAEIKAEYDAMMEQFDYNSLIFNSKMSFEPIIGETYHVYERESGETFLSIIAPDHCNFNHVGSFYLNAGMIWEKVGGN